MHAMKTKPHSYLDLLSKMKTSFALLLIGLILLPSIAAACPGHKHKKTTCLHHLARRRHADGVQMTEDRPPSIEETLAERERLLREARPRPSLEGRGRLSVGTHR